MNLPLKEYTLIIIPIFCFNFAYIYTSVKATFVIFLAMKVQKFLTLGMKENFSDFSQVDSTSEITIRIH